MKKGISKIAEQVGQYGIYGELELTCSFSDSYREIEIVLPTDLYLWKPGILFGSIYFWEHTSLKGGLVVNVNELMFNPVDTNMTVVAYLTTLALEQASGISMRAAPFFDKKAIAFVFPK